jgi:hypothetical protein
MGRLSFELRKQRRPVAAAPSIAFADLYERHTDE